MLKEIDEVLADINVKIKKQRTDKNTTRLIMKSVRRTNRWQL